ncbi:MAG: hypothetical protein ACKO04_05795 [Actinomycetes bacterium]
MQRIRRWGTLAVTVAATAVAACTTAPPGTPVPTTVPTTAPSTTTTLPGTDDSFTLVFVGDSEARMRGNTDAEVSAYVANLASYRTSKVAYFDHQGGTHRILPELVVLGGDISADRDTSVAKDMPIWQQLYDQGIAFVAGFGNHDWEPAVWGDGSLGYSVAGEQSNQEVTAFTNETYRRSSELSEDFSYQAVGPSSTNGPTTFLATYKGVDIANFNTFLYQPSYYFPFGWPLTCNLGTGGAGCQTFVSAESQIQGLQNRLSTDPSRTTVFVEHYPLTTSDSWWDDHGASGTTVQQKKDRLKGLMARFDHTVLLAGHNHSPGHYTHSYAGRTLHEHVAPYFGGGNGVDPSVGGGFLALLVSPTRGILEVKTVPGGN